MRQWLLCAALLSSVVTVYADSRRVHSHGHLEEIVVTGRAETLLGQARAASQGRIGQIELASRPVLRAGELLEVVPGVAVTQHSGTGKANQFFLRGFNLDHGTDFAGYLDGVPLNQPTHGHGQGYLDLNPIIPELVERIDFGKGPYYADTGDFSTAGFARYETSRHIHGPLLKFTGGENEFFRALGAGSTRIGGGDLLGALEAVTNNGPWELDEDGHKFNALIKYSASRARADYSLSLLAYDADWDSTDQVPQRALQQNLISPLGNIDPTLGGASQRYSANLELAIEADRGHYHANAYLVRSELELFSNFTYFLDNPFNGDQITQIDRRWTGGFNTSYEHSHHLFARHALTTIGLQVRHDNIVDLGLRRSRARLPLSIVRDDEASQTGLGIFLINETQLSNWLRARLGLRTDHYWFDINSSLAANSGREADTAISPKIALIARPWSNTEFYLNYGQSFHSNDGRGTVNTIDPSSSTPTDPVDPLVESWGAEFGARSSVIPNLNSTFTVWYLELDSELVFVGDAGTTEAQGASQRYGIEWNNHYRVTNWLTLDLDLALTQSKFTDVVDDEVPNSVGRVITGGATIDLPMGLFGAARARHFGDSPLNENATAHARSTTVVNLRAGYRWGERLELTLDVFNLFDSGDPDISYFFASCLPSDPVSACGAALAERSGVDDVHLHPVEPRQVRGTLQYRF
ncbi:MAG: TonB-dependent receptor [Pseudomonadota bacterium]